VNIVIGVFGTTYSSARLTNKIFNGKTSRLRDCTNALVGGISTFASIAAATELTFAGAALISNPVRWGIGIAAGIYFWARFVYDLNE
jgi:hypothetical protein